MLHPASNPHRWVVLLAQLPAAPSSARVALWRRMRSLGAASLLNGAWTLPASDDIIELFQQSATRVREQGGHADVLVAETVAGGDAAVIARFEADRGLEYDEFAERGDALLAEITKETGREKFTFAELEEIEDDHQKLADWLVKIEARDFFPGERRDAARALLGRCQTARDAFAAAVYAREVPDPDE